MRNNCMRLNVIVEETARPILPNDAQSEIQEWLDQPGRVCAQGYAAAGYCWLRWPGLATFRFDQTESVVVFPEKLLSAVLIDDLFKRSVYPLILQSRGIEVLHASGSLISNGVMAFCAEAGTGKSTLVFNLGRRGYPIWADDAVTFDQVEDTFVSCRLPYSLRLLPDAVSYFGEMNTAKAYGPNLSNTEKDFDVKPLAAVCIINRVDSINWEILRLKPSEAFTALLQHGYYYSTPNPAHKQAMLKHYLNLIDRVPIYQINFKPGFEFIDDLVNGIDGLITELAK